MKAGWEVRPLGDAATFVMGQAPAGSDCNREGIGTPFVKAGEFGERRPIIREWTTDPKKFAKETDVLICVVGATCGKINLGADCAIGRSAAAIRPKAERLDQFYLHYYLEGQVQKFRAGSVGAAQTVISRDMLSEMPIPLPPLKEQQQIVAVLDEAFEGLTRAHAHAEANLQNARELFDEVVNACFAKANALDGDATTLGALAEFRNGLNYTRTSTGRSVKIVGVGDFKDHFNVPLDTLSAITIDGELAANDQLRAGDIIAVRSNGNRELIGRTMLVPSLAEQVSFSGFTIRIRLITDKLLPEYLCEYMRTKKARRTLIDGGGGSNISNLNQGLLSSLPIRFPDLAAQRDTLHELDLARTQSIELVRQYETKLQSLDALRQSLLQRAFSGELT